MRWFTPSETVGYATLCAPVILVTGSELFGTSLCHVDTAALVKALIGALHGSIS
jgi:hypothetical protein